MLRFWAVVLQAAMFWKPLFVGAGATGMAGGGPGGGGGFKGGGSSRYIEATALTHAAYCHRRPVGRASRPSARGCGRRRACPVPAVQISGLAFGSTARRWRIDPERTRRHSRHLV